MSDKSDLEEMRKQAENSYSLGAHQAYINALEFRVKELEEGIRKHKEICYPNREPGGWWDSELYKLIE